MTAPTKPRESPPDKPLEEWTTAEILEWVVYCSSNWEGRHDHDCRSEVSTFDTCGCSYAVDTRDLDIDTTEGFRQCTTHWLESRMRTLSMRWP